MSLSWINTSSQIQASQPDLAILPLATVGTPGQGLPENTNYRIVSEIARRVALKCSRRVFLLPCWPYGTPGAVSELSTSISLEYKTLWAVVKDIVGSLLAHDIRQVAIVNDLGTSAFISALPGGNEIVKTAVRQLNYENPGLHTVWIQPFRIGQKVLRSIFPSTSEDLLDEVAKDSMLLHLDDREGNSVGRLSPLDREDGSPAKGEQAFLKISDSVGEYIERSLEILSLP